MVSMKLAAVHSPTDRPEPQQRAGTALQHLVDRSGKNASDGRRQPAEDRRHGQLRILGQPEEAGRRPRPGS